MGNDKSPSEPSGEVVGINRDAYTEFIHEFRNESDRAAVILGAAKLDYLLLQIAAKFLLPNVGSRDELLEGDSGLATFSSRIHFCYRAGLIDAEFVRALHMIRKIRNDFAHEVAGCNLNTGPHQDRIRSLALPFSGLKEYQRYKDQFFKEKLGASADFFSILGIMVIRLELLLEKLVPLDHSQVLNLIPAVFFDSLKQKGKKGQKPDPEA
jgi:hypothetical protein